MGRLKVAYSCPRCLQIIHLKRFDYVNSKWVKTQKVVNFPFKNFDPTAYLASVPQETILRHKQLLETLKTNNSQGDLESSCESSTEKIVEENGDDLDDKSVKLVDVEGDSERKAVQHQQKMKERSAGKVRQRLESTSLVKTPINDKDLKDYHQHKLLKGQDPFDLKYQLYAVVVSCYAIYFVKVVSSPRYWPKSDREGSISFNSRSCRFNGAINLWLFNVK